VPTLSEGQARRSACIAVTHINTTRTMVYTAVVEVTLLVSLTGKGTCPLNSLSTSPPVSDPVSSQRARRTARAGASKRSGITRSDFLLRLRCSTSPPSALDQSRFNDLIPKVKSESLGPRISAKPHGSARRPPPFPPPPSPLPPPPIPSPPLTFAVRKASMKLMVRAGTMQ